MLLVTILFLVHEVAKCAGIEVIYAVNSGGPAHVDMYGTHYQEDPLTIGIPSDYGKSMPIARVPPSDAILYQTERYHLSTFGYDIPIKEDGEYVLVLKFCEVWFTSSRMKVTLKSLFLKFFLIVLVLSCLWVCLCDVLLLIILFGFRM